jgi:proline iminopeptidase
MSQIGRYQVVIGDKGPTNEDNDNGNKDEHCDGGNVRVAKNTTIDANNGFPIILSYCIFRPRQLHDENKPPLLCLHGGPSIPSNYLLPIVNGVTDRAVIFYDQWGCGKSSRPPPQAKTNDENVNNKKTQYAPFSIPTMVEHLRQLIEEHWKLKRFHLLGHSFGGILAYEYLLTMKRQQEDFVWQHGACLCSLILSSTPTSAELIQSESERLFLNLTNGGNNDTNDIGNGDDDDDDDDDGLAAGEKNSCNPPNKRRKQQLHQSMKYSEEFRQTHECRLPNLPLSLMDALAQMGPIPWRGIQAIDGYEAGKEVDDSDKVPSLLMRGEYDFCTEHCMKGWKERLWSPSNGDAEPEEKVLSNCSHYAMLEDETLFGAEILRFVTSHDAHRRNDIF